MRYIKKYVRYLTKQNFFFFIIMKENISRKVTSEDNGKGQIVESEKALSWNFLFLSGTIPLTSIFHRKPKTSFCKKLPNIYHENLIGVSSDYCRSAGEIWEREKWNEVHGNVRG